MKKKSTIVNQPDKTETIHAEMLNTHSIKNVNRDHSLCDHSHGRLKKFPFGSAHGPAAFWFNRKKVWFLISEWPLIHERMVYFNSPYQEKIWRAQTAHAKQINHTPKTKLIADHYYFISIFAILRNWLIISVIVYHILLTVHIFFNCSLRQLGYRCTFRRSHYFEWGSIYIYIISSTKIIVGCAAGYNRRIPWW